MPITLILGGARSGKSAYAEKLAALSDDKVIYIATAKIRDDAIDDRIKLHQQRRPTDWQTVECPLKLGHVINGLSKSDNTILVDCLTMWVTNMLCDENAAQLLIKEQKSFFNSLKQAKGHIILVSNEVGMGIVPMGELTRDYVDIAGRLHQDIAEVADKAVLVVAGLPMVLKE